MAPPLQRSYISGKPLNASSSKPNESPYFASYASSTHNSSFNAGPNSLISMSSKQWMKQEPLLSQWRIIKKIIGIIKNWGGGHSVPKKSLPRPERTPTIDNVTQTVDLTKEVRIPNQNVVSHGGFSDIYRGEWEQGSESLTKDGNSEGVSTVQVAVKLLRVFTRREVDLERSRKRLNREVNIWKNLNHPNIAKFLGVSFQLGGRPALVMQWYENGTAPSYIKDRPLEFRLTLVKEVCAGLKYLHNLDCPVVHGDLKGNNILVDDEGHPVLSDFGLSKMIDDIGGPTGNTTTTLAGTVRWQAPELLFDEEEPEDGADPPPPAGPTLASDVWSLACTVYELISGHFPYHHRLYDWKVIQDVMDGKGPLQPDDDMIHQSEGLVKILNECWTLDPADRPNMHVVESRMAALSLN
ncbi:kinase-like domain-containing protein [Collybia nuda]|uniref:Kinase-like domain-containing protein n=1 Tax=Collybia nuda TaxID=64659 RepID=A0A9P5XWI6_9AGAR|nr:kinase-like domain-containing protein [Collybia nuda]